MVCVRRSESSVAPSNPYKMITCTGVGRGLDEAVAEIAGERQAVQQAREMWEAPYASVCECLARPGSKARARGALSVSAFKHLPLARRVWPPGAERQL